MNRFEPFPRKAVCRCWLRVLLVLVWMGLCVGISQAAERNIVLIVADDLSPDLGCYGNPVVKTPNIDQLAAESTLYDYAYATTASCSASRSVIFSGLHNHSNGQFGHQHNYHNFSAQPWVQSLPVLLHRQGYRTANVGKFHVAPESVFHFDERLISTNRTPERMAENCREFLASQGKTGQAKSDKPFFLYFATNDTHRSGGIAMDRPGRPNQFGNEVADREGLSKVEYSPGEVVVPSFLPDSLECRAELAQYYQSISRFDSGVGRLIKVLKETGHWESTLVIVTADHGMAFPGAKTTVYEAGLRVPFVVRDPYQPLNKTVRSDALISLLDITPTLVDYAQGIDHATGQVKGLEKEKWEWKTFSPEDERFALGEVGEMKWVPYTFHGRSILPTLGKSSTPGWDSMTASHTFHEIQNYYPMRVYRDRKYKLIWNIAHQLPFPFSSDLWTAPTWKAQHRQGPDAPFGFRTIRSMMQHPKFELFDMEQDPEEKKNLADDSQHADVLARYIEKLRSFQHATGDPGARKWNYE